MWAAWRMKKAAVRRREARERFPHAPWHRDELRSMNNSIQRSAVPLNTSAVGNTPNVTTKVPDDDPSAPPILPCALTAAQTARLLGISESHLYDLLKEGRFGPEPKRLGRARRFDRDEVLAWFRAGCPNRARWQAMQPRRSR